MRINQLRVSKSILFFRPMMREKYGLKEYSDANEPCIFFGCYKNFDRDARFIDNHKGLAVLVWGGSDAGQLKNRPEILSIMKKPNIKHIAISKFIEDDLRELGICYYSLPVCPTIHIGFEPCELGEYVYIYGAEHEQDIYNIRLCEKIEKELPDIKFVYSLNKQYSYKEIKKIYKRCFCGLRLTRHDGLSNTVVEMGLMGRRVLWNGSDIPNAEPWETEKDIKNFIRTEKERTEFNDLPDRVKQFLDIKEDWLRTCYYGY